MSALAYVYEGIGRMSQAEELYRKCLAGRLALLGEDNDYTVVAMNNLAVLLVIILLLHF
jgi:Flp pilus assembly protein TadD